MSEANASKISTHYYKLAHLSTINYSIYSSPTSNDQSLLELELQIRYNHPKILITYYNKCLYYFSFGHLSSTAELTKFDPSAYSILQLKHSNTTTVELLANPPKASGSNYDSSVDEYLPFASLSFLKSVKKMVLFNLSTHGTLKLFGNNSIILKGKYEHSILYLDPILLPNGDLLLSILVKNQMKLFDSLLLSLKIEESTPQDLNFVIYLIPSGIRCHLFDPTNLKVNFVKKKALGNENLLNLIKLSTGLDYSNQELSWIKLIPNLKHLNNQTSPVSKFIHSVDNKKFILWPWNLCLLQFGKYEELKDAYNENLPYTNPLDLIGEFMDFSISNNQNSLLVQNQPFSIFSNISSGIGSNGPNTILDSHQPKEMNSVELNELNTPMVSDLFNADTTDLFGKEDINESRNFEQTKDLQDDMEIDDLFGDDDDDDEVMNSGEGDKDLCHIQLEDSKLEQPPNLNELEPEKLDELFDTGNGSVTKISPVKPPQDVLDSKPSFINIPKDQMMFKKLSTTDCKNPNTPDSKDILKKLNTPDYNDPGAPLPILPTPTPMIPSTVQYNSGYSTNAPPSAPNSDAYPSDEKVVNTQKSIFSPIMFNPIIKSNIDTKYGKGGKFYVDKESTDTDLTIKKKMRATSVSGFEISHHDERKSQFNTSVASISPSSVSSEESDIDEEIMDQISNSPPLKLNTLPESGFGINPIPLDTMSTGGLHLSMPNAANNTAISNIIEKPLFNSSNITTGGFGSPNTGSINRFPNKADSPFFSTDLQQTISPIDYDNNQQTPQLGSVTNSSGNPRTPIVAEDMKKSKSESSNYLPLILRNINVTTIPNTFLLNNLISSVLLPNFDINEDENTDDLATKSNEMMLKFEHIDELLNYLVPNLIFDLGLNKIKSKFNNFGGSKFDEKLLTQIEDINETQNSEPYNPNSPRNNMSLLSTDFNSSTTLSNDFHGFISPPKSFESSFFLIFPNSYKVGLSEFLFDFKELDNYNELDNQLNFLDDITNDDNLLNPNGQYKKLKSIEWDSIEGGEVNKTNYDKYKSTLTQFSSNLIISDQVYFKLPRIKSRVLKNHNIINLNSVGLDFWKYLNFSPIKPGKNFQILLLTEKQDNYSSFNDEFLNKLIHNYSECNFGQISKVNLSTVETRSDLESVKNGLITIHNENDLYLQLNRKLNSLVELIRLDLINKTNNFEFDRPLLLLFVNFNNEMNSMLQISKIIRNFKISLTKYQLPLVNIFTKVIPASFFVKQLKNQYQLKILSNFKLSKLSMNLYNQCPDDLENKSFSKNSFTQLVKEPPLKIHFKFMNTNFKDNNFNDDIFLHVAYERSIDKNWFSAAWSDAFGDVNYIKSWFCLGNGNANQTASTQSNNISSITDDMWTISNSLFKKLNDDMNSKSCALGGKKFLVLTRVNSIIPDDELVHWKRLSVKHKEISLIVLSVSDAPKVINEMPQKPRSYSQNQPTIEKEAFFKNFTSNNSSPNTGGNLMTSPHGISFHSPQQFLNAPGNFLSPQDLAPVSGTHSRNMNDTDYILHDPNSDIYGVLPKVPLPLFNSPTRLGMKIGCLVKELNDQGNYLIYEVNLLSCSNYWDVDVLMKVILKQYKNLIVLNDVLGLRDLDGNLNSKEDDQLNYEITGIIPWHIAAVKKSLDYLVHVYVEM